MEALASCRTLLIYTFDADTAVSFVDVKLTNTAFTRITLPSSEGAPIAMASMPKSFFSNILFSMLVVISVSFGQIVQILRILFDKKMYGAL
ncbi:MAG: hypothetical protein H3C41_03230 [Bacteroidales bacterium]|mgnify:CR=1 FL=1|nr:hypothetical protein [Bacteroidales bacterium]